MTYENILTPEIDRNQSKEKYPKNNNSIKMCKFRCGFDPDDDKEIISAFQLIFDTISCEYSHILSDLFLYFG